MYFLIHLSSIVLTFSVFTFSLVLFVCFYSDVKCFEIIKKKHQFVAFHTFFQFKSLSVWEERGI